MIPDSAAASTDNQPVTEFADSASGGPWEATARARRPVGVRARRPSGETPRLSCAAHIDAWAGWVQVPTVYSSAQPGKRRACALPRLLRPPWGHYPSQPA
jgi:hypothetical protein